MEINNELIDHISHLSRLEFDGEAKEVIKKDLINMIEFVDSRFEQYSNNGIEDMEVYIVNCLTQPEPDFWTTIQRYSSIHEEVTEKYKMRTDHWWWHIFPLRRTSNESKKLKKPMVHSLKMRR